VRLGIGGRRASVTPPSGYMYVLLMVLTLTLTLTLTPSGYVLLTVLIRRDDGVDGEEVRVRVRISVTC